jgi:hypothetical protein
MGQLTILESESFWDELMKRSPEGEDILLNQGRTRVREFLRIAFELKAEYDAKTSPLSGMEEST